MSDAGYLDKIGNMPPPEHTTYPLLKPLPEKAVQRRVAPALGQKGGGVQFRLDHSVKWYIRHEYLGVKR